MASNEDNFFFQIKKIPEILINKYKKKPFSKKQNPIKTILNKNFRKKNFFKKKFQRKKIQKKKKLEKNCNKCNCKYNCNKN